MSTDYSQAAKDILDGLSSPTADEAYHATRNYDERYIAAALASLQAAAGGGSQAGTPRVIKTVVDFTDLAAGTDGLTVDLLTLPVGSCVLGWWVDPDTFVNWDSQDENADGWLGQGAGWHPPHNGTFGRIITPGTSASFDSTSGETEAGSSNRRYSLAGAQSLKGSALLVTQTTDPVQVWWDTGGQPPDPATVGHSEIYFLVAEAPIPTS